MVGWATQMLFLLILPTLLVDWHREPDGTWKDTVGDQLLVSDFPPRFPKPKISERLIRFHTLHATSTLFLESGRGDVAEFGS